MIARHTSSPIKSAKASGPIGWLAPSFIALSISSALAIPSARTPIASFTIGINILFTTKPGASFTLTGVLPRDSVNLIIVSSVSSEVGNPLIISTSFIRGTGLKKCIPITLSGLFVAVASSVIERDEVFVAKIVSGLQSSSSSAKRAFLASISSVAASIIRSASFTIEISVEPVMRPITSFFSSSVSFSFAISLSRFFSIVAIPLSIDVCLLALSTTS